MEKRDGVHHSRHNHGSSSSSSLWQPWMFKLKAVDAIATQARGHGHSIWAHNSHGCEIFRVANSQWSRPLDLFEPRSSKPPWLLKLQALGGYGHLSCESRSSRPQLLYLSSRSWLFNWWSWLVTNNKFWIFMDLSWIFFKLSISAVR